MKKTRTIAALLAAVIIFSTSAVPASAASGEMKISLGADLDGEQLNEVLSLLSLSVSDLTENEVVYVTNEEEHEYLDKYIDADKIGNEALSSSKIIIQTEGHGITVTTYNINYCTTGMYKNALITAGVEDADVYVAGPVKLTGTAALIGIMKAYNEATDGSLNEENIEAATEELSVTGEIASSLLDSENAEQIIAELKTYLDEIANEDDSTIDSRIKEVASSYGEELSDEDVAKIRELLKTLAGLDLDSLLGKAKELYESLTNLKESADGLQGILNNIGSFLSNIFDTISNWFKQLF